jgi:hypothetical protein
VSITLRRRSGTPSAEGRPRRRRRRWLIAGAVVLLLIAGFAVATVKLFLQPQEGMPARVDAIVMLDGPGDRLSTAMNLEFGHRASMMVVSRGSGYWGTGSRCAPQVTGVKVICFDPSPPTTQGEAEFAGRLAKRYHWKTIVMVTITAQITPGRIWLSRCLPGVTIYAVSAPLSAHQWPRVLFHEWGAVINAELLHRSC